MDIKNLTKGLEEKRALLMECAEMLEKYLSRYPEETGLVSFQGDDMKRWNETFYPKLVQTGEVIDYQFFHPTATHLGIGSDGVFSPYDYMHFMYRLYKKIYEQGAMK